jgi:hypothetical protein
MRGWGENWFISAFARAAWATRNREVAETNLKIERTTARANFSSPCPSNQYMVMIITMTKRLFILLFAVVALIAPVTPLSTVRAADDEVVIVDGRLQGYVDGKGQPANVQLEPSGTAVIWLTAGLLGAVAIGFMFMSSKRTHLD